MKSDTKVSLYMLATILLFIGAVILFVLCFDGSSGVPVVKLIAVLMLLFLSFGCYSESQYIYYWESDE